MSLLGVSVFAVISESAVDVDFDATLFVQLVLFVLDLLGEGGEGGVEVVLAFLERNGRGGRGQLRL